ncbi:10354_t:CDS:2 [Funneliformis geosporum]|nr:10354_t:CDS:2 [Funneliformis geosporum]
MTEVKLIQKIDSNYGADSKIEINGKQMTIEEYNRPSHFKEVKVKCGKYFSKAPPQIEKVKYYLGSDNDFLNNELKARKLFAEMAGSLMDENGEYPEESIQLQEIRKNEKVNKNLYADINRKKDALNHLYNFNLKNKEVNQEFYNSFTGLNIKHFDNNCKQAKIIVENETGQTPGEEHVPTETPTKDKEKKKENLRKD